MNRNRCRMELIGFLSAAIICCQVAQADPFPEETDPAKIATSFRALRNGWTVSSHGYGGPGDGKWNYAVLGSRTWSNYAAEFDLKLVQPASQKDGLELGAYTNYHALANLGGYEMAVVVRYESKERHYRISVSSLWNEIVVWRPTGGVVQVVEFPFEMERKYRLRVECRGPRITVLVDHKKLIDWWDTADPVLQGCVGIARKEGESYLARIKTESLPSADEKPPAHKAAIHPRNWHGEQYFFDGQEPLFVLTRSNILDHMRFMPGYRPQMYAFNYVTDWSQFQPSRLTNLQVLETGDRLVLQTTAEDPNRKSTITSSARLEVTYDARRGMYQYDHACTTTIGSLADAEKVAVPWDHGDAVFLGCVGSSQTRDPNAFRPIPKWAVFQSQDGNHYKVPMNPNFHYLGRSSTNGGKLKHHGGHLVAIGDSVVSPVIQIPDLPRDTSDINVGLCWWAFDVHTLFTPKTTGGKLAPSAYTTRVTYTGMKAAESQRLFERSTFFEPLDLTPEIPVFAGGIGHTETFDKKVKLATPHCEHRIWAGAIDTTVGHGDRSSLRLDGPTEAWTLTGPSYFTSPFGKRVVVSAWVKTRETTGEGPAIGFHRMDDNRGEFHCTGLTGTHDWTPIHFATTFPADVFGAHLYFRNSGGGTVWFDNVKIEPVEKLPPATDVSPVKPYPIHSTNPDLVLQWSVKEGIASILDASGYGHHGKIYGNTAWAKSDNKPALILDGQTTYVWPLSSPELTLGPPATVAMEIKPESVGTLMVWGFQFSYRLTGGPDYFSVEYEPSGAKPVTSKPCVKANQWQQLALVMTESKISLFVDGKFVEDLGVRPQPGNWALHVQSTWHRHLSFFGFGPGDMSLVNEPSSYHLKGQLRSLQVFRRTLSESQLQALRSDE